MTKYERIVRQMVQDSGLTLVELKVSGGNHYNAKLKARDGRTAVHVLAKTPSENRAGKNAEANMRRFARGQVCTA